MQNCLNLTCRYLPSRASITAELAKVDERRKRDAELKGELPDLILQSYADTLPDLFESRAVIAHVDGDWKDIACIDNSFDDLPEDCPLFYLQHTDVWSLGVIKKKDDRSVMSVDWTHDYFQDTEMLPLLRMVLEDFIDQPCYFNDQGREMLVMASVLMEWEPDVDWETGHDEGCFAPVKVITSFS